MIELDKKMIVDLISIFGSFASIVGLIIVFYQLQSVKQITQSTKDSIFKVITVSDLSKTIKIIQEIQSYNRSQKYELSLLRLQELKHSLIGYKLDSKLSDFIDKKKIKRFLTDIDINIKNLEEALTPESNSNDLDTISVSKLLEDISTTLVEIQTHLKRI